MKKILLGLFALSAMAMAITNPGDNQASAQLKNYGEVGVPMEVRVQILPEEARLILVDENDKKIDKLTFDHRQLLKSASDSVIEKTVKLKLEDGTTLGENKVKFKAKQDGAEIGVDNKFVLNLHGSSTKKTLDSTLVYRKDVIDTTDTTTEVSTQVVSTIKSSDIKTADAGLYIGSGTFEAAIANKNHVEDIKK